MGILNVFHSSLRCIRSHLPLKGGWVIAIFGLSLVGFPINETPAQEASSSNYPRSVAEYLGSITTQDLQGLLFDLSPKMTGAQEFFRLMVNLEDHPDFAHDRLAETIASSPWRDDFKNPITENDKERLIGKIRRSINEKIVHLIGRGSINTSAKRRRDPRLLERGTRISYDYLEFMSKIKTSDDKTIKSFSDIGIAPYKRLGDLIHRYQPPLTKSDLDEVPLKDHEIDRLARQATSERYGYPPSWSIREAQKHFDTENELFFEAKKKKKEALLRKRATLKRKLNKTKRRLVGNWKNRRRFLQAAYQSITREVRSLDQQNPPVLGEEIKQYFEDRRAYFSNTHHKAKSPEPDLSPWFKDVIQDLENLRVENLKAILKHAGKKKSRLQKIRRWFSRTTVDPPYVDYEAPKLILEPQIPQMNPKDWTVDSIQQDSQPSVKPDRKAKKQIDRQLRKSYRVSQKAEKANKPFKGQIVIQPEDFSKLEILGIHDFEGDDFEADSLFVKTNSRQKKKARLTQKKNLQGKALPATHQWVEVRYQDKIYKVFLNSFGELGFDFSIFPRQEGFYKKRYKNEAWRLFLQNTFSRDRYLKELIDELRLLQHSDLSKQELVELFKKKDIRSRFGPLDGEVDNLTEILSRYGKPSSESVANSIEFARYVVSPYYWQARDQIAKSKNRPSFPESAGKRIGKIKERWLSFKNRYLGRYAKSLKTYPFRVMLYTLVALNAIDLTQMTSRMVIEDYTPRQIGEGIRSIGEIIELKEIEPFLDDLPKDDQKLIRSLFEGQTLPLTEERLKKLIPNEPERGSVSRVLSQWKSKRFMDKSFIIDPERRTLKTLLDPEAWKRGWKWGLSLIDIEAIDLFKRPGIGDLFSFIELNDIYATNWPEPSAKDAKVLFRIDPMGKKASELPVYFDQNLNNTPWTRMLPMSSAYQPFQDEFRIFSRLPDFTRQSRFVIPSPPGYQPSSVAVIQNAGLPDETVTPIKNIYHSETRNLYGFNITSAFDAQGIEAHRSGAQLRIGFRKDPNPPQIDSRWRHLKISATAQELRKAGFRALANQVEKLTGSATLKGLVSLDEIAKAIRETAQYTFIKERLGLNSYELSQRIKNNQALGIEDFSHFVIDQCAHWMCNGAARFTDTLIPDQTSIDGKPIRIELLPSLLRDPDSLEVTTADRHVRNIIFTEDTNGRFSYKFDTTPLSRVPEATKEANDDMSRKLADEELQDLKQQLKKLARAAIVPGPETPLPPLDRPPRPIRIPQDLRRVKPRQTASTPSKARSTPKKRKPLDAVNLDRLKNLKAELLDLLEAKNLRPRQIADTPLGRYLRGVQIIERAVRENLPEEVFSKELQQAFRVVSSQNEDLNDYLQRVTQKTIQELDYLQKTYVRPKASKTKRQLPAKPPKNSALLLFTTSGESPRGKSLFRAKLENLITEFNTVSKTRFTLSIDPSCRKPLVRHLESPDS